MESYKTAYSAYLYSTLTRTFMYGIYTTTLVHCLRWLLFSDEGWRIRQRIDWRMLTITILLFLMSTIDLALTFKSSIDFKDRKEFTRYSKVLNPLEDGTLLIVDGVLIYRCWAVNRKTWRVIYLPIVLWLVAFVCAIIRPYYYYHPLGNSFRERLLHGAITATFYGCNITINLYATSLIVFRILNVAHKTRAVGIARRLHRTTRIIAESGILFTLTSIVNLVSTVLKHVPWQRIPQPQNYFGPMADAINYSMAGIAFNLILMRVGQNRSSERQRDQIELSAWHIHTPSDILQDELDTEENVARGPVQKS